MQLDTCSTPDRGYMGDPRRGASLGRADRDAANLAKDAREDIERLTRTLQSFADGFEPGWYDTDPATGESRFTPNFPTPESRAEWVAGLEAKLANARERLETAERASADPAPRFYLRRVRLDSGGYDSGGSYWGHGGALFEAFTADGCEFQVLRIWPDDLRAAVLEDPRIVMLPARKREREAAKHAVREAYPTARFFN